MWYRLNLTGSIFYITDDDKAYSVQEDGGFCTGLDAERIRQNAIRIDKPKREWADTFLRSLDKAPAKFRDAGRDAIERAIEVMSDALENVAFGSQGSPRSIATACLNDVENILIGSHIEPKE